MGGGELAGLSAVSRVWRVGRLDGGVRTFVWTPWLLVWKGRDGPGVCSVFLEVIFWGDDVDAGTDLIGNTGTKVECMVGSETEV